MLHKYYNYFLLHFIVIIYGFTGILGRLITINPELIAWYRMFIAAVGIVFIILFSTNVKRVLLRHKMLFFSVGLIIAAHWTTFFLAIHISNISLTLVCLSSASLFTAIIEPILFNRKIYFYEIVLGLAIVVGISLILKFETKYTMGIIISLISAFFAASFNTINGKLIKKYSSKTISLYEMIGGFFGLTCYLFFTGKMTITIFLFGTYDIIWLLILGLACTSFAFIIGIQVMKELNPFTTTLIINLEPVYGIILALIIFGESEKMTSGFYLGTVMIFITIFANSIIRKKMKSKHSLQQI